MIGTGYDVRVKIQDIVSSQLPSFILNESPLTDDFLKQFYVSQEFQGGAVDFASNLDQYLDLSLMTRDVIAGEFELTAPLSDDDTVVYVNSTRSFPSEWGLLKVDQEIMTYTGITTNSFTGVVRGFSGVTSYDAVNQPGELVFQQSIASAHAEGSEVENLSTLFVKEFYNKLKATFAPGFENLDLNPQINVGTFISQTRSFYQTKGSVESINILFKVLFGEEPTVIDLEKFLIKPSEAEYSRADYVTATPIDGEGNPVELKGRTIFQSDNNTIFGAVSEIEPFTRDNRTYYKMLLFVASEEIDDERKLFTIPGRTKAQRAWSGGDTTLTVDTTIGFRDNGEFINADGVKFFYEEKTVNQFLGVTCEDPDVSISIDDEILDDIFVFGTNSEGETIKMRLMGVLSEANFDSIPFSSEGEVIQLDSLGENILSSNATRNDLNFKQIVANSFIYNTKVRFEVTDVQGSSFAVNASYLDKAYIKEGDTVDVLERGSQQIIVSDRLVDSVDFLNSTITISDSFGIPTDRAIDIRRRQRYAQSDTSFIEYGNDRVLTDVLNLYDATEYDSNLYVATNSLPSYDITASIVESQITSITPQNFEDYNSFTAEYATLVFDSEVDFITGDIISYSTLGTAEPIMTPGEYYVEVLSDRRKVRFYLSPSFIGSASFVGLTETSAPGRHIFTLESQKGRVINAAKTYRKIPLTGEEQNITVDRVPAPTGTGVIAVLTNGVEVLSYQARDKVFLGPVESVEVASGGEGYSVVSPPTLVVSEPTLQVSDLSIIPAGISTRAEITPVIKGKLERILIDPQNFNINEVFSITVEGGNSSGATGRPKIETKKRNIAFDARLDTLGGGINPDENSILFQGNHNLIEGQAIIYDNRDFQSVLVVNEQAQTVPLANGAKYFAGILNSRTIQLYQTASDYRAGINTVQFDPTSTSSGSQQFSTEPRKSLVGADIVEDGGFFYYRSMEFTQQTVVEEYDEIRYPSHGFSTGDLVIYSVEDGAAIDPLVDGDEYYVVAIDEDTIKLCLVGPSDDLKFYLDRREFINLLDGGDSTSKHNIRYPDVTVNVVFSVGEGVIGSITATPIVRGEIDQIYVNEGSYYGTDILNFEKNPTVEIERGALARIQPVVINGEIVSVQILSKGRNYPSDADLVVEDSSGAGIGAVLRGVFVDGELDDVIIINGGQSYNQNTTTVDVIDPAENAILIPRVRDLTVNLQARFGFESLEDNQYRVVSYERTIREGVYDDLGNTHSPIIGWANDGNPIYGGFGLDDPEDPNSGFRAMVTSYVERASEVYGRPSLTKYPAGFFVEDYAYVGPEGGGDLDAYNGRYCRTPEFPNGTYAYFAGISTDTQSLAKVPQFPYFIGPEYRDAPFDQSSANVSQDFNINNKPIYRNTFPYAVGNPFVGSEFLTQSYLFDNQETIITTITQGTINDIQIIGAGVSYSVGDIPVFDSGEDTITSVVSDIQGKEVLEISNETLSYDRLDTRLIRLNDSTVRVYVDPSHDYLENDSVIFSGLSTTLTSLAGPQIIKLDQRTMSLYSPLQATATTLRGQVDDIFVNTINNNVSVGSSITIGVGTLTEVAEVINIFPINKALRINRLDGYEFVHPIGDTVTPINNFFDVKTESPEFISNLDESYYFNPKQTMAVGTEPGVGYAATYSIGNISKDLSIETSSIYAPMHKFKNVEPAVFRKDPNPAVALIVAEDPISGISVELPPFGTNETDIFVVSKNANHIGIRTTADGPDLFFTNNGSDNFLYNITSKRQYEDVILDRIQANVTVAEPHGLQNNDIVSMSIINTGTTGVGSNTSVVVEFDDVTQSLIVDPQFSDSIGVSTELNTVTIDDHGYVRGDYVLYESTTPIGGLNDHEKYFVVPFDKNKFQLAKTFKDIQLGSEIIIDLSSTGSGIHKFSKVNPKLNITSNSNIRFDLSSPTLLEREFDFYYDRERTEIFDNNGIDFDFVVSGVSTEGYPGAEKVIQYSENNPTTLYYGASKGGYISTTDTNTNQYNAIEYVDSVYSRDAVVTVNSPTEFVYSLSTQPEEASYNDLTASLKYTTTSKTATGGVGKVRIINSGKAFNSLPEFITINSATGSNATLKAVSDDIGTISDYRIQNPGWGYSADRTLRPAAKVQPKLEYDDSDFVTGITVTKQASGYQTEPDAVLVDSVTREVIDNGSLLVEVQSSVVTGVEIEVAPSGLSKNRHEVYTVNNTNGIPILAIVETDSNAGIVSAVLQTPIGGYPVQPFEVGDSVFVENVIGVGVGSVSNLNSPNIGYRFAEVIEYNSQPPVSLRLQYPEDVNIGIAKTFQGAFSSMLNKKNYPEFQVDQATAVFIVGERLSIFNELGGLIETDLVVEESNTNFFKISGDYDVLPGDRLKGSISGVIVTVTNITSQTCTFTINPTSRVDAGWLDNIGFLNDEFQNTPDNDYYQNLSYSIKSTINYEDLAGPVNRIVHPSGLKNFSDTKIESSASIGIAATDINSTITLDFIGLTDVANTPLRVDRINVFDLGYDAEVQDGKSNAIRLNSKVPNKRLSQFIEVTTNRVLLHDDISNQFIDADNSKRKNPWVDFSVITGVYTRSLLQTRNPFTDEVQLTEIISLTENNVASTMQKASVFDGDTSRGVFEAIALNSSEYVLRFSPSDPDNFDSDIKLFTNKFAGNSEPAKDIGYVSLFGNTFTIPGGEVRQIFGAPAGENAVIAQISVTRSNAIPVYLEFYVFSDGTNTYSSTYEFDNSVSNKYSQSFGTLTSNLDGLGRIRIFMENTDPDICLIDVKYTTFKPTETGDNPYRFLKNGVPVGSERGLNLLSNRVSGSTSDASIDVLTLDVDLFQTARVVAHIEGSTIGAIHQVMIANSNDDTYTNTYPFITEGNGVGGSGIGTFGTVINGSDWTLQFYPDATTIEPVTVTSYVEAFYREYDSVNYNPNPLVYSNNEERYYLQEYVAPLGLRNNKTRFALTYQGTPIYEKSFFPEEVLGNISTTPPEYDVFLLKDHFFSDAEELYYTPDTTIEGQSVSPMLVDIPGIGATTMPSTVYAIKRDLNRFQLAVSRASALNREFITITGFGQGNAHRIGMKKKLAKSAITVNGVMQAPIASTLLQYELDETVDSEDTFLTLTGIGTIKVGDVMHIDETEYVTINNVGFATVPEGPITNSGTFPLIEVERGTLGSIATSHTITTGMELYKGTFNIVESDIIFVEAPAGRGDQEINQSNIVEVNASFQGRTFLQKEYDEITIFDNISNQFNGIKNTFTLTSVGGTFPEVANGNGALVINDIYQTPSAENNPDNNYFYNFNALTGETTVVFTGIENRQGDRIESEFDINQNQIPRGGLIVSVGSTPGLGYAPLSQAIIRAEVTSGAITGIITADQVGVTTGIQYAEYDKDTGYLDVTLLGAPVSPATSIVDADYFNTSGRVLVESSVPLSTLNLQAGDPVKLDGLEFSCVSSGITTTIFPDQDNSFSVESIIDETRFAVDVGISTIEHTYVGGGTFQKFEQFSFGTDEFDPDFVYLDGLEFSCPSGQTVGLTTTIFPVDTNKVPVVFVTDSTHLRLQVGISTLEHIYVGGGSIGQYTSLSVGSGYNSEVVVAVTEEGHTGVAASIMAIPGPGGELTFNIINGGTGYTNPYVNVPSPDYFNLPTKTVFRRNVVGVPTDGNQGKNLFITCEVGSSKTTAIGRSEYFNVNNFELTNLGYGFELGDVVEVVGLVTAKGLSQPLEPFQITIDEVFDDNFSAWSFGEQDYLDNIKPLQDGVRTRFPIVYEGRELSFETNLNDEDSAAIDLDSLLLIYVDTVLQVPGVDYFFDGGSSFEFVEAPLPQEEIDIYFYKGKDGIDSQLVTDINESIRPGDEVQLKRNDANKDNIQTQDIRTATEIAASDTLRTNLYVGNNDLDTVKPRQLAWDKQKRDIFIYSLPVYKTRDSLESIIKPQARIIRNASSTSAELFLSTTDLFNYEEESGGFNNDFKVNIIKTLADEFVPASLKVNVDGAGRVSSIDVLDGGRGYNFPFNEVSISKPIDINGTRAIARAIISNPNTGEIGSVSIINPGSGYSQTIPALAIARDVDIRYENVQVVPTVQGFSGIVTGIEYRNGSEPGNGGFNSMVFHYKVDTDRAADLPDLQVGYPVVISNTVVGPGGGPGGIIPTRQSTGQIVSIAGDFSDAIYEVREASNGSTIGRISCRIQAPISDPNLPSGVIFGGDNLGSISWGRIAGMTREPDNGSLSYTDIEDQQFTPDMANYPKVTRTSEGLRDKGGINKVIN